MPVKMIDASGNLLQIKIRGMLKKADYDRIVQMAKEAISREGKIRALAILDGFEGWERHAVPDFCSNLRTRQTRRPFASSAAVPST